MDEQKKDQCGQQEKGCQFVGSTFGGVIGVVQIGENNQVLW